MCDRWMESFDNFLEDMGTKPKGLSIDRIDVDGPYSPENCRWADTITQNRNRTNSVLYDGKTLMEIMEERDEVEAYRRVRFCLFKGLSLEQALQSKPKRPKIEFHGKWVSPSSYARLRGVDHVTLLKHMDRGLSPDEAVALIEFNRENMTELQKEKCLRR